MNAKEQAAYRKARERGMTASDALAHARAPAMRIRATYTRLRKEDWSPKAAYERAKERECEREARSSDGSCGYGYCEPSYTRRYDREDFHSDG